MRKKESNGWMITAIISIVINVLIIISFITLVNIGMEDLEKETECSLNICDDESFWYEYDSLTKVCTCLDINSDIIKSTVMED